jgi:hypothetical protein
MTKPLFSPCSFRLAPLLAMSVGAGAGLEGRACSMKGDWGGVWAGRARCM